MFNMIFNKIQAMALLTKAKIVAIASAVYLALVAMYNVAFVILNEFIQMFEAVKLLG